MDKSKVLILLCLFCAVVFTTPAHAEERDGHWILVNKETGTWERTVVISGRKIAVRAFVLTESGRASLYVNEPCENGKTERLAWSAGDGYGVLISCTDEVIRSNLPTLIERELDEGLPKALQKKMREIHKEKGILVLKDVPLGTSFLY